MLHMLIMSEISEYFSNSTESRGEKRVINYTNLSESLRLKRKRKVETETPIWKKRRHTENEVSKNSFRLNDLKSSGNTVETFIHRFRMDLIFVWGKAKNCPLLSFLSVLD